MAPDTFLTLLALAFAAAWTPGPNNALVAASGANFGMRATLPHVAGIGLGFPLMIFIVGMFLGQLFQASSILREGLRWGGAALLLWISWRIATSGGISSTKGNPRPFTFLESAGFQWINPKGWAMAIAVTAQFITDQNAVVTAAIVAGVFVAAGFSSAFAWASAGRALTRWINTDHRLVWFNRTMAVLIASTVVMLFLS
ncbi:MAG: LysE family translocator [Brevirhabdus sp.]